MTGRKGLLLINTGSPNSPAKRDIRAYLRQFLSDPRVMTMPAVIRWLLLNLYILPFRPGQIEEKYAGIWDGSSFPLLKYGYRLKEKVQGLLGEDFAVRLAMRYGNPSLETVLEEMRQLNIKELHILPLFPQYASATTGSAIEKIISIIRPWSVIPGLRIHPPFFEHPSFIESWAEIGGEYYSDDFEHVLFSFHGLPESHILDADVSRKYCLSSNECCDTLTGVNQHCYRAQCRRTADLIAGKLDIPVEKYSFSFQSRLGRTKWIEPYTSDHLRALGSRGITRLLVFCPSFVADCLETTEEIGTEARKEFMESGGRKYVLVPSLNDRDSWAEAVVRMIR